MKVLILCLLVSVAVAMPQNRFANWRPTVSHRAPVRQGRIISAAAAAPNFGPKAYGPGLNNPFAFPPNPFTVQRAVALANTHQGLLVRVDIDGEVELTDRFGREVDGVYDNFGRDLSELYDI